MRIGFDRQEIAQTKIPHSLLTHLVFFSIAALIDQLPANKVSKTESAVVFDFGEVHTDGGKGDEADAEPVLFALGKTEPRQAIGGNFAPPIDTVSKIGSAFAALREYGMILEKVRSRESAADAVKYDREIDDFYTSVAENWHRTRPIASMKHDLLVSVKFEAEDRIVVNISAGSDKASGAEVDDTDGADKTAQRVFKERAVNAVYAAYQHRAYAIPVGTQLRFRFVAP